MHITYMYQITKSVLADNINNICSKLLVIYYPSEEVIIVLNVDVLHVQFLHEYIL